MKEEKQTKMKKSTKYLLIGTLVLFLSILGASVAYYLARVSGNLSGRAAGTELDVQVQKLSSNANMDLIPLDNDLETLQLAAAGYQDKGACVDINGYSVCQIYKITVTNNGSVPLTMNGTVTLSGQNTPNIDCATMTNATTVANNNSCMGQNVFVSGDTLAANDHKDYYVMVYINNLDEQQTDSGEFTGVVTFTTEDGRKLKGRFTKPFNLVQRIETLYNVNNNDLVTTTTKAEATNNSIVYNYATNVGLMKDRLGGTSATPDSGNIRYYGAEPNNWIDIGDKTVNEVRQGNWVSILGGNVTTIEQCKSSIGITDESTEEQIAEVNSQIAAVTNYSTVEEFCNISTTPAGTPILWRIIGVFDGKLRVRRDENIGSSFAFDVSQPTINGGHGINQWGASGNYEGADLMKLLNPGYENNSDKDYEGNNITVNNSLYWNRGSGTCYQYDNDARHWNAMACDFTNTGLSDEAKEYIVDQTLYLGGFDTTNVYVNQAWANERGNNVFNSTKSCFGQSNCNDTVERTLTWTGKVGLIYPSDFGYAADFSDSNCQGQLSSLYNCTKNWMNTGFPWTVSPWAGNADIGMFVDSGRFRYDDADYGNGGWPVLTLSSEALAETGTGSKSDPYVLTS